MKSDINPKKEIRRKWKSGNRAFHWTENVPHIDQPLCLQSKQYNLDEKGVTWVYYSKTDAYKLYKFLKGIFAK